jgi:uncharacterized protein (DUF1800 family)
MMRPQDGFDIGVRAQNRFGLGVRAGEAGSIDDPRAWLEAQIEDRNARLAARAPVTAADVGNAFDTRDGARRRVNNAGESATPESVETLQEAFQDAQQRIRDISRVEIGSLLGVRVRTARPFVERLVAFWSNHLCVSVAAKPGQVGPFAGLYEREAIRPHVLGRFEDMVLASARHPAMLFYLDNVQSIGPGSVVARRLSNRGLNENYARELLELHTVGVDGGYSQDDVVALARILTGWSIAGAGPVRQLLGGDAGLADSDAPAFRFYPILHEPGEHTVLGVRYAEDGENQGIAAIRDLCRHPSTARFVATKLVRHFVADQPEARDVERIASVFRETGGDLREVSRALIHLDGAWDPEVRKFRTPQDWLVAAFRALGVDEYPDRLVPLLNQLRHPVWSPPSPKGYGDTRGEWADPDSLMNRAELARSLTRRVGGPAPDAVGLLEAFEQGRASPLTALLEDKTIAPAERIALVIGGPEFQWR